MTVLRVQAAIPRDTGLPEDVSVNTWHFLTDPGPASDSVREAIFTALGTFYTSVQNFFSAINASPITMRAYDMNDPKPRAIIDERSHPITPSVSASLPEEVAIAISFQGARLSGVPQARRRGRIYLGPVTATPAVTGGRVRIGGTDLTALRNAANALLTASNTAADWSWCVLSTTPSIPSGGDFSLNATIVTNGWVDDTFDTQRRRGPAPTLRSVFP